MISVIIATKNRPDKLIHSLNSVLRNSYKKFEIVIADQSENLKTKKLVRQMQNTKLIYIVSRKGGKSAALNSALKIAKGETIAFTDDDCRHDKNWLKNLEKNFKQKKVGAVFGKTLPFEPEKHPGKFCPSIFMNKKRSVVKSPKSHLYNIGFGNNMAIRRNTFTKIGVFKEWLGPGSVGSNAEDAEMAFRILLNGFHIVYDPSALTYHDRWLTPDGIEAANLSYDCGEIACYGYYMSRGFSFAGPVISKNFERSRKEFTEIISKISSFKWDRALLHTIKVYFVRLLYKLRGIAVARYFSIADRSSLNSL